MHHTDPARRIELMCHALAGESANLDERATLLADGLRGELRSRTTALHEALQRYLRTAPTRPIQTSLRLAERLDRLTEAMHRLRTSAHAPLKEMKRLHTRLKALERQIDKLERSDRR